MSEDTLFVKKLKRKTKCYWHTAFWISLMHRQAQQCCWQSICVACASQPVCMCVFTRMFAGCYLLAYSQHVWLSQTCSLRHTHTYSQTYTAQSIPLPVKPHAVLLACNLPSSLTAGCRREVRWSGPGLIRLQPPFLFYVSVAHTPQSICPSIHQSDPQAAQHKHLLPLLLFMPEVPSTGLCVCLCPCPDHLPPYPEPPALATT